MGGRGSGGGPGPGTGAQRNKGGGGAGAGSGGVGGGGGSAGSGGGGAGGTGNAGTGGVTGGGGAGGNSGGGGGGSTTTTTAPKLTIGFDSDLTSSEKEAEKSRFDKLPTHLKQELAARGTKLWVGTRADNTPGWHEYAKTTNTKSTDKIADGREVGTLSFYDPSTNEIFISARHPGGSVNVYVHELGHAIDFTWNKNQSKGVEWPPGSGNQFAVKYIHNDPQWKEIHENFVLTNPNIINYYKYGPNTPPSSGQTPDWMLADGRSELFAEGFAMYNAGGRMRLMGFVGSAAAADQMIAVWKRYGVIK